MAETEPNGLDGLAGEYVLGTLPPEERLAAEARLATDPAFRRAVAAWERRLQPLADAAPPAAPSADLLDRILGAIPGDANTGSAGGNVVALRRSLRRWRLTSTGLAAAAAALAAIVVFDHAFAPKPQTEFVAVLTAEGAKPAFVATIDIAKGTLAIRRVAGAAPAGKSYELWAVAPNAAPKSLGLVEQASFTRPIKESFGGDLTLAVSLEPQGGSPTGAPTGPVVFSGALVASQ